MGEILGGRDSIEKNKEIKQYFDKIIELSKGGRPEVAEIKRKLQDLSISKFDTLEILRNLGYDVPEMDLVMKELGDIIQMMPIIDSNLIRAAKTKDIIFLARDGELMYDYFRLRYPQKKHKFHLLPASALLWDQMDKVDPAVAKSFFNLNKINIDCPQNYILVDSGFKGRVGARIWATIERANPSKTFQELRKTMPLYLVSKPGRGYGEQIFDFRDKEPENLELYFPRVSLLPQISGPMQPNESTEYECDRFGFRLATAMQIMPRYYGNSVK